MKRLGLARVATISAGLLFLLGLHWDYAACEEHGSTLVCPPQAVNDLVTRLAFMSLAIVVAFIDPFFKDHRAVPLVSSIVLLAVAASLQTLAFFVTVPCMIVLFALPVLVNRPPGLLVFAYAAFSIASILFLMRGLSFDSWAPVWIVVSSSIIFALACFTTAHHLFVRPSAARETSQ